MVSIAEMIKLLNDDLSWEYTAAIQYIQHSGVLKGAEYGDILKEIKLHAQEEIQHALILVDQISYLGGNPTVRVYDAKKSKDNKEMLRQDLDGELDALRRYKERIKQAEELQEYALSQKLREILSMEQEHAMDLQTALGL
ncbi:MAG: ferritin-like domain-containing protein [Candidatus Thermoplasmatota archaeon]|nr:ferritin-like domain-containing protein [Candidatus Thermoplasmatota archaeon]